MKRREKSRRQVVGGYLTVYMALSLWVMLSLFFVLLDGIRQSTVRMESQIIADIGMDSILAEYHRELFERYGLLFVDISYGTREADISNMEEHLRSYLEKNCESREVFLGDWLYRDLLELSVAESKIMGLAYATDQRGSVFYERAVEASKQTLGISYLESALEWLDQMTNAGLIERNPEEEKEQLDEVLAEYDQTVTVKDGQQVTIEVENPTRKLNEQKKEGILKLVVSGEASVSRASVSTGNLVSSRYRNNLVSQGNWSFEEGEGNRKDIGECLLFHEYMLANTSCYTNLDNEIEEDETAITEEKTAEAESNSDILKYQTEYVLAGHGQDVENLKEVVHRILLIREAANLVYLLQDETKVSQAQAVAAGIAAACASPELEPVLKGVILLGWAYAESIYDVRQLLSGRHVVLFKTADTWKLGIESALEGIGQGSSEEEGKEDSEEGLDYQDYLRVLLLLGEEETQTFRMMDVIEMNIRSLPGNFGFRMDACVDRISAQIVINSAYGPRAELNRSKMY